MERSLSQKKSLFFLRVCTAAAAGVFFVFVAGCGHSSGPQHELAYVSAVQATLRDHLSAVYQKTGSVTNGEQVEVLEHSHNGRFVRVRTSDHEEGWMELRLLAPESVYAAAQQLAQQNAAVPTQDTGTARTETNMHIAPSRTADHLYQLENGDKVQILKRAFSPLPNSSAPVLSASTEKPAVPAPAYEDWWLVRDAHNHYGWVLAHMVDMDVPLDVAQYAEGRRIMATFILNQVQDGGKAVPQYLMLLNPTEAGEPQDFDEARVFTWDAHRHRYETAFIERKLSGMLPASVGTANFGKEGTLPTFTLQVRGEDGKLQTENYKLDGVMVRRVLAAGEAPPAVSRRVVRHRKRR